jgi:hypothetical protein
VDTSEEDKFECSGTLPDPELNPMLNPTLGRNLGRWAQVYFTSPPEKREQAVQELLRELESMPETAPKTIGESKNSQGEIRRSQREVSNREELLLEAPEESCVCPACLHKNTSGQRYCGFCGFSLEDSGSDVLPTPVPETSRAVRIVPAPMAEREADNWQWLHEKHLAELANAHERRERWKYFFLGLVLIAVPAGYAVWHTPGSTPSKPTPAVSKPAPQETAPVPTPVLSQVPSPKRTVPVDPDARTAEAEEAANPPSEETANPVNEAASPVSGEAADSSPAPQVASSQVDYGAQELVEGRRLLYGQGVRQDHTAAAKWLWRSVAKQNVEAVLLLSDLYVRGDGVPQSCDQARVLLTAGAKKGSSVAAEKLHLLLNSCR